MRFSIKARLDYDFGAPVEVLLLLEAAQSRDQAIHSESLSIVPSVPIARLDDPISGERRAVFTAFGRMKIAYTADVDVLPRAARLRGLKAAAIRDLPGDALSYLRPSRYCPSDRFEAFVFQEFGTFEGGDKVAEIVAWVAGHLEYRVGVSNAWTTAQDTFIERAGVCRDYAHLTISLLRAAQIPARAVSAYSWRLRPPDLHAVVEVYLGDRWQLLDPTGLAPVDGLVRVATGRDAADIAFMTIFGRAELVSQSFTISRKLPLPNS